jgi:hypothetical protein
MFRAHLQSIVSRQEHNMAMILLLLLKRLSVDLDEKVRAHLQPVFRRPGIERGNGTFIKFDILLTVYHYVSQ